MNEDLMMSLAALVYLIDKHFQGQVNAWDLKALVMEYSRNLTEPDLVFLLSILAEGGYLQVQGETLTLTPRCRELTGQIKNS